MIKKILVIASTAFFMSAASGHAAPPSAADIVLRADEIRSPQIDYTVDAIVTSVKPEGEKIVSKYEVLVKGRENAVIKTLSPPIDRGRTLLTIGRDMWVYLPDVSKPVRISLQERLVGEVANGDIARTNFSGDYRARLVRTEKLDDGKYYVLDLSAKSEDVTYNRVLYWVRTDDFRPYKAEFYAVSGKLLKLCFYEDYKEMGGGVRPARLVLKDPLVKGRVSTIEYGNMRVKELPAKFFTKDYMKKFKY